MKVAEQLEDIESDPELPARLTTPVKNRLPVLAVAAILFALVFSFEWISELEFSLGVFYVFPIIVAAIVLNRGWIILLSLVSAFVRGLFIAGLATHEFWLRFAMAELAYSGIGLFVVELTRNRRKVLAAYARLKLEKEMRHKAEARLRILAESSPAAILTLDGAGTVLAANRAAHEMLGYSHPETLIGKNVEEHVPLFAGALRVRNTSDHPIRTSASSWAKRANGLTFPVATWFSTYTSGEGHYLAGILVDSSEEVRERERENFQHMLDYNRLLAGAVSHEIRNMCLAIRVATSNLAKKIEVASDSDFGALTTLVNSLASIASLDLNQGKTRNADWVSLGTVFEELRVVIEPDWNDVDGRVQWNVEVPLPRVYGSVHGLLQIFLNLSHNSLRAANGRESPTLAFSSRTEGEHVIISAVDNGPGVQDASLLFQPFRPEANGSGLGLYISRTLARSFGGQLTYVPTASGCRFDLTLLNEAAHSQPE